MSSNSNVIIGPFIFAFGGTLLLYVLYLVVRDARSPWINQGLFSIYVLGLGFAAFFLLGLGLLEIIKSAMSSKE